MSRSRRGLAFECQPTSPRAIGRMAVGAVAVLVIGLLLGSAVDSISPMPAEQRALAAVAGQRSPALTTFFAVVTTLGDLEVVAFAAAVATPLLRRRLGGWEAPWLLWATMLGALAVTAAIKVVVGRARPLDAIVEADTAAFPSGHTSRAAAVLGLVAVAAIVLADRPAVRRAVVGCCAVGIALMGFSRIYLGVHWPTDVAYGMVVGFAWLAVVLMAVRPRRPATGPRRRAAPT